MDGFNENMFPIYERMSKDLRVSVATEDDGRQSYQTKYLPNNRYSNTVTLKRPESHLRLYQKNM